MIDEDDLNNKLEDIKYYNKVGKSYKAESILQEIITDYPDNPFVKFDYALILSKRNSDDIDKAMDILESLINDNEPNRLAAAYEYIKLGIYNFKRFDKVLEYIAQLQDANYKNREVEFYYGKYYEKNKDFINARIHYEKALNLGYNRAKTSLTRIDFKTQNVDRKNETINNICEKENFSFDEIKMRIKILLREKNISEVYNSLKKAEQLLSDYKNNNLGNIFVIFKLYMEISKVDEAEALYEKYKDTIKEDNMRDYYEASIALGRNNYAKAVKKFKKAATLKGYPFESYYFLALLASLNGDFEKEKYYYDKMAEISENVFYLICMVNYYIKINDKEKASELLDKIPEDFVTGNYLKIAQFRALLGKTTKEDLQCYSIKQIVHYNDNVAVEHIENHKKESNDIGHFKEDVNIRELLDDVRTKIDIKNPLLADVLHHHILEYPGIGQLNDVEYNYVEVITIPNTNNVITMYPVLSNNIFATNYNYEKEKTKSKVYKRESQIDKFYRKYGK